MSVVDPRGARPSLARTLAIAAVLGQVVCGARPASEAERRPAPGRRIVLVGLDGADWLRIDPLVQAGRLPTFARLKQSGRTGVLLSTPPLVSPIVWTTIATGRPPQDHAVLDFMADRPAGGQAPVSSAQRRVPALWNLFSEAGRTVAVVGWWATAPAETVKGTIVSDRVAPQLLRRERTLDPEAVFPAEARGRVGAAVVSLETIGARDLSAYAPVTAAEQATARSALAGPPSALYADPVAHLTAVIAGTRTYATLAESLARERSYDLLAVYLEGIDTLSHRFIRDRRGAAVIEAAYRDADQLLARLAQASPPDALIVVCSDHGFQPPEAGVEVDPADLRGPATAWHRPYGIVAVVEAGTLAGGTPASLSPGPLGTITPLDIAPTVLHAAGLAVGAEMPGRVVTAMLPPDAAARTVERRSTSAWHPVAASAATASATPDQAAVARLQALGYLGARPSSLAYQNLGEVLYRAGNPAGAERALRTAVEAQPQNLAAHLWLAKALRDQGRAREAVKVYQQSLRLPGARKEALVEAVETAVAAGLVEEATALLTEAGRAPDDGAAGRAALHTARAVTARARSRPEAERELRAALAADALSFDALSRLFDVLLGAGRVREMLPLARSAAVKAPASPRHVALLGEVWLAAGEPARAAEAFRSALALAPDAASVRLDLARAALALGRANEAQATLAESPPSYERSVLLGAAYSAQRNWKAAADEITSALDHGAATPALLNGLGWARQQLGQKAEARTALRRSLELDGRQPEIRRLLADLDKSGP
jgi:tetratricopeptide (TPR) repeat protein